MSGVKQPSNAQAGDYLLAVDRRLIPIALLIPLALAVDIIAKAADIGNAVRLGIAALAGAVFVGVSVAMSTNRASTSTSGLGQRSIDALREEVAALADDDLGARALELYWAEIDLDESVSPELKSLLLLNLAEAVDQLRDPKTAAKGRGRLRDFVFNLALHRGGARQLRRRRARVPEGARTAETRTAEARTASGGHVNAGVDLERSGDLAGAEAAYRRADSAGDINGAVRLGALLERHGETAAADAYRRADLRGSAAGSARFGRLLEERGDLAGAEAAFRRADARGSPAGAAGLASILERLGRQDEAEAAYERSAEHTVQLIGARTDSAAQAMRTEASATGERGAPRSSQMDRSRVGQVTFAPGDADLEELRSAVDDAVSELRRPGSDASESAKALGVPPSALADVEFSIEEVSGNFDPVSLAIVVTSALGAQAMTKIWDNIVLPRVRRRLGEQAHVREARRGSAHRAQQLAELSRLHAQGVLTDDELAGFKQRLRDGNA